MIITASTLKRPVAAAVLALSVLVIGFYGFKQLEVNYLPEVTYPLIKIHIWWPGATPEEIEKNIAEPVERVMATLDHLDYLESSSLEGTYTLQVNFEYGVSVENAYQDVIAAMGRVNRQLPKDMDPPVVIKADPSQLPVMQVTVSSSKRSLVWLRDWCENWLQDQINVIPGTAGLEIVGGLKREIRVHIDPDKLKAYKLSPAVVANALFNENRETFAGRVTIEPKEIIARTMGEFESLDEIRNVVVASQNGRLVYLKNIAKVEDSHEDARILTRFNGKDCVKLNILKQAEANTVKTAERVKKRLEQLREFVPEDIKFGVVENQGAYVSAAVGSVLNSLVAAAILVILVTYCFLGDWRQILTLMAAMPITLAGNFIFMWLAGFSLNLFSLAGLVVATGMVLDNSIVAIENISRLRANGVKEFSLEGTKQISSSMIAATFSFLALVLPFLLVPGITTLLFKELVLTIAGVVVISLFVAWTITPLMMHFLFRKNSRPRRLSSVNRLNDLMQKLYHKWLVAALDNKWLVVLLAFALIVLSLMLKVGTEFLPRLDDGRIMVKLIMPAGASVKKVDAILKSMETELEKQPFIESVFTMSGGKTWGLYTFDVANEGELNIQLVPKSERSLSTDDFIKKIMPLAKKCVAPGGKMPVKHMRIKGIRKTGDQEVEVKVKGTDIRKVFDFAVEAAEKLRDVEGLSGVNLSMDMTKPEYRIYIDRAKASALGISVKSVAETLQALVHGIVPTRLRDGAEYYDIRVMVPEEKIKSKSDLEGLVLENCRGKKFFVRDIAEVRRAVGPVEITRDNQAKMVVVRADAHGISVGEAVRRADEAVGKMKRPPGVFYEMGGQAQMMREMNRTVLLVIVFAVFFAFVALAVQFESLKLPFLVLLSLPPVLAGMLWGLKFTGLALGATVAIGALIVISATINDGVLLLSFAEELRLKEKLSAFSAVLEAAAIRLRPRLMTTFSTIAGFTPLALNWGEGGDLLQPMAVAAISGLLFEIFVTLFLLPCLYCAFSRKAG